MMMRMTTTEFARTKKQRTSSLSSSSRFGVLMMFLCYCCLSNQMIMVNGDGDPFCSAPPNADGSPNQITVAGSSTVFPLSVKWANHYFNVCDHTVLNVVSPPEGSSVGAARVCDQSSKNNPVEVGDMSRPWKSSEAVSTDHFTYNCVNSTRTVMQIAVAIDGLTVATAKNSIANDCIMKLGGLTLNQLRWIFSNETREYLISTGWDPKSIPNSDGDDTTHLWSELNSTCAKEEIMIAGPGTNSGTFQYFKENIFTSSTSKVRDDFPLAGRNTTVNGTSTAIVPNFNTSNPEDIVKYLTSNPTAIGFFGYAYLVEHTDTLASTPIYNGFNYVVPQAKTILSGSYSPFSRRIYMNIWINDVVLQALRPFFVFAFSSTGTEDVKSIGLVPLPEWEQQIMLTRLGAMGGTNVTDIKCPTTGGSLMIAGSTTVKPIMDMWAGVYEVKCSNVNITTDGGGSTRGFTRVCDMNKESLSTVDIGLMARSIDKNTEAKTTNGFEYDCNGSDRQIIQIQVATDGLTVAVQRGGPADICIEKIGGLSIDQLRWMYSSFTETQLNATGWSVASIPNSDNDPNTHLWSELHKDCDAIEILTAGANPLSGKYDFFASIVLKAPNEDYARNRATIQYFEDQDDQNLVQYLVDNGAAISFFGYAYYADNAAAINSVPIQNSAGNFVRPSDVTVVDGTYNPLSRPLYLFLYDDFNSLQLTRPFLDFGFSPQGQSLISLTGYSKIGKLETIIMLSRAQTSRGISLDSVSPFCGPAGAQIDIAGSSTVFPITNLWAGIYEIACPVQVNVQGGGSTLGALRVCGGGKDGPVEIGDMSRAWLTSEAVPRPTNSRIFDCQQADKKRSVIQIQVAVDGLTVAAHVGSDAQKCIEILGGLTMDQLRWLFSSYTEKQLIATGWNPSAVPNTDGDDTTHKWSELNKQCANSEAIISGADDLSGTQLYFKQTVLTDYRNKEDFDRNRNKGYFNSAVDEDLIAYVVKNNNAITYFGFSYFYENQDTVFAAPIQNSKGVFVPPSDITIHDGNYSPLSRPLYMNLLLDKKSLKETIPFVQFGLSKTGRDLIDATGYVNIPMKSVDEQLGMLNAAFQSAGQALSDSGDDDEAGLEPGGIAGVVIGAFVIFACAVGLTFMQGSRGDGIVQETGMPPPEKGETSAVEAGHPADENRVVS